MKISAYKIASTDNDNFPFISFLKKLNKPIILSTAMSDFNDVKLAYALLNKSNFKKFSIMQCTGNYPTSIKNANLNVIDSYKKKFKCPIGFSDHTEGNTAGICAVAKGVKIIEKHFTISKKLFGPDHRMSLEPGELINYIKSIRLAEKSLGMIEKKVIPSEIENKKKLKKSLVARKDIKKGQKISKHFIDIKRPGNGIRPIEMNKIIGKIVNRNLKKNTIFKFNMFK